MTFQSGLNVDKVKEKTDEEIALASESIKLANMEIEEYDYRRKGFLDKLHLPGKRL
ncbi:MAG: hypothetical protein KKD86_16695 [Bacteroidetes bacterium]|nr:hypothetical protein [Bacteroidota bacterium]